MNNIEKQAKMEAFFRQHVIDNIETSLGASEASVKKTIDFIVKVGRITKTDAVNMLNEDKREANKLVDILQDLEKYKTHVENEDDDSEEEPDDEEKREFYQQHDYSAMEIHPLERDVSSPLPHSTFNVPEGQLLHPVGPAG